MIKEKVKQLNCFLGRIREKYGAFMIGLGILIPFSIYSRVFDSYPFSFIVVLLFTFQIGMLNLLFGVAKILKKSINPTSRMAILVLNSVIILPLLYYVIALNTWVSWFGFSISDSMIIFQMLGFVLLFPKITKFVTRLVVHQNFHEKYDKNNPSHYWMRDLVRAYAILIILAGFAFQIEALQYFLYDNNLM